MELYTLRYVLAVADSGNFSLAAQACHVGQPALSQQIAKLEKELGVALFARNPRGATLTEAGKDFVLRAREILQRAQALQAEMSFYAGLRKGSLNLGIITSLQCINFGGMLSAFCGSYPDISVNIVQEGDPPAAGPAAGPEGGSGLSQPPLSQLASSLEFVKLGEDHYSLAVPVSTPLAGRGGQPAGAEGGSTSFSTRPARWPRSCASPPAAGRALSRTSSAAPAAPTTTLYMVQGGLGVAFLPSEDFHSHTLSGVREIKLKERIVKEVGWPGAGTRPPPWWTPQSSSPGSGSNDRPLLSSFPLSLLLYNRAIPLRRSFL